VTAPGSLTEAAELLRAGRVTARSLAEDALRTIAATEPTLHAYAHVLEDSALAEADRADAELAEGSSRGQLHGVPVAVKDIIFTADAPTEAGSEVLRGFRPDYDATVVQRLRAAGAVIVGKTVTHEFAYGQNPIPTRNARDPQRDPGGSSAGSAVAVASGSAFAALGTDTGGSVRTPASLNGIVGLKPTYGRLSRHGVIPLSPSLDTVGVFARTVRDCAVVTAALAGRDPLDVASLDEPVGDFAGGLDAPVAGRRVGVVRTLLDPPAATDEVAAAVRRALGAFAELGVEQVDVGGEEFEIARAVGMTIALVEGAASHAPLVAVAASRYDRGTLAMLRAGSAIAGVDYLRAIRARSILISRLRDLFARNALDALLLPSLPTVAARVGGTSTDMLGGEASLAQFLRYQSLANVAGLPAISIPCEDARTSLPVGLQLVARPLAEDTLLQLAHAVEGRLLDSRRTEVAT